MKKEISSDITTKGTSAAQENSKISEDEMKRKLLGAASASQPVAAAETEDAEGLEDMLDDLI